MDLSKEFTDALLNLRKRIDAGLEYSEAITECTRLVDSEVSKHRTAAVEQVMELQVNSFARGVIPLSTLLEIMSLDGAVLGRKPSLATLDADERARHWEYKAMLPAVKDGIKSGSLIVSALGTLVPVNTHSAVARWCATSDTLKTAAEMAPPPRIVVKGDDAVAWLTGLGISIPTWLETLAKARTSDLAPSEQEQSPAVEPIHKETPEQRRARLLSEIEQGANKADLCKKEGVGSRRLNQLLVRAKKDRASQNNKFTAILGK